MLRLISRHLSYQKQARRFVTAVARRGLSQQAAQSVTHNTNDQCLAVKWHDGTEDKFPYLYLRENCRCEKCLDGVQNGRTYTVPKCIDLNVAAKTTDLNNDGEQLNVTWRDGHFSVYSSEFLRNLRYKKPGEGQPAGVLREGTKIWGSELSKEGKIPTFDFEKLLKDDRELYNWLVTLALETGIAKLKNVSPKSNQLKVLGDRVGYLLQTNYGDVFELTAYNDDRATSVGYTSGNLPMHSDFSFCHTSPAVAMLRCVEQTESEGGVGHWVDSFHVAHLLHQEDPESFNILAHTPIAMRNVAKTRHGLFHTACRRNIISLDHNEKVCAVCYSDEFRDANMPLPPEKMKLFYKVYYRFTELMYDKRTSFWYKVKPGEIMTTDNHRVLHGRSAYHDSDTNVRVLHLAYLDWDCVHSKIRILAEEQGITSPVD